MGKIELNGSGGLDQQRFAVRAHAEYQILRAPSAIGAQLNTQQAVRRGKPDTIGVEYETICAGLLFRRKQFPEFRTFVHGSVCRENPYMRVFRSKFRQRRKGSKHDPENSTGTQQFRYDARAGAGTRKILDQNHAAWSKPGTRGYEEVICLNSDF